MTRISRKKDGRYRYVLWMYKRDSGVYVSQIIDQGHYWYTESVAARQETIAGENHVVEFMISSDLEAVSRDVLEEFARQWVAAQRSR